MQVGYAHSVETCRLVSDPVPALLQDHALVLVPSLPLSDRVLLHLLAAAVQVHREVAPDGCLWHVEPAQLLAFLAYQMVAPAAVVALVASEDALVAFVA